MGAISEILYLSIGNKAMTYAALKRWFLFLWKTFLEVTPAIITLCSWYIMTASD
jgi:hypothetical protein